MLYYNFKDYEEFKSLFGIIKHGNEKKSRKNRILLAYLKDKKLLHRAVTSGDYTFLHISGMGELKSRMEHEVIRSGSEDNSLPYSLRLMGKSYYSSIYETDGNDGLCEDGDPKAIRYYNHKTEKTFKMKAGKLYRHLILETQFGKGLPEQVTTYLCEEFSSEWQSYTMGKLPKNRLHVNRDFEKIYSSYHCKGDFHSCMADRGFYGFYEDSVNSSAAYLEDDESGKVIARCIIFNEVKDQDGKIWRLAERQYSTGNDDVLKRALVDALIKGGYIDGYKKIGASCGDARSFVDTEGNSLSDREFRIECNLEFEDDLCYQDSFKWYNYFTKTADNYGEGDIDLSITDGSIDNSEQEYDDYHGYYCDNTYSVYHHGTEYQCDSENLGDFIWIESLGEYHHKDDVLECYGCGEYFLKSETCYSEVTREDYCCKECLETDEKEYKESNWHYSDYDDDYFEDETEITCYQHWNQETGGYEERSISESSLIRLLRDEEFHEFDNVFFDRIDPTTNLPYGYKLIKIVA